MSSFFLASLILRAQRRFARVLTNRLIFTQYMKLQFLAKHLRTHMHTEGTQKYFQKPLCHRSYLSVWPPPRRKHWGRHNKGPSSRSCTRSCRWCPSASSFPRSYRVSSRTNGPCSEGVQGQIRYQPLTGFAV